MQGDCPHCAPVGSTSVLRHLLEETAHFRLVHDAHPITEGHLLIIPKHHLPCIGACNEALFREFRELYDRSKVRLGKICGHVSTFEHGVIGQTVFHAHVHILPYGGTPESIVTEGRSHCTPLEDLSVLSDIFEREGKYLFFSTNGEQWLVDTALGKPRFLRDRFASALSHPERGNWKSMRENAAFMARAEEEIERFKERWGSAHQA